MIVKLGKMGEKRIAARLSEYESINNIIALSSYISWVWVDVFTCLPITKKLSENIHNMNLKICLVSPELQNQNEKVDDYINILKNNNIKIDAVCSKKYNISKWKQFFI